MAQMNSVVRGGREQLVLLPGLWTVGDSDYRMTGPHPDNLWVHNTRPNYE
jgi:hypothetical protein